MVELLAPVRDEVSFTAALGAGADSVYMGIGELNMRVSARGVDVDMLGRLVEQAHQHGVKVYVALNSIVYDDELARVDELLDAIEQAGADAVIGWDFAVIRKAGRRGIPLHISTQASISNIEAVRFYEELGAKRIVLARELSLEQIQEIKKQTDLEIEVFVHGAMCVSVSGRCFMSQFLSCRSANRGDCLQPCRREYRVVDVETGDELDISNGYVMSPKDLCTLPIIDKLMGAGIDAFKIEGRGRSPEYIQRVTGAYRRAIDAAEDGCFSRELVEELMVQVRKVYNRGFSQGFLLGRPGASDWSDQDGSKATQSKVFVGKVLNYFKNSRILYAQVVSQPLAVGDTVQIQGSTTGVIRFEVTQLKTDKNGFISRIDKGKVTFPCEALVRENDQIYKIVNSN